MAEDLSQFLTCNYGTTSLKVDTYKVRREVEIKAGRGRVGEKITVEVGGFIDGTSAADFTAKLAAAAVDLSTSRRDFAIIGLSGAAVFAIPAARVLDFGPHIKSLEQKPGEQPLRERFAFTVEASTLPSGFSGKDKKDPNDPDETYELAITTRPDGLRTVVRSGELLGFDAVDFLLGSIVPDFQERFGLPGWVVDLDYRATDKASPVKVAYKLTARELQAALPAVADDLAVSGDATITQDSDESGRRLTTFEFDLLVKGDALRLVQQIRGGILSGAIGPSRPVATEDGGLYSSLPGDDPSRTVNGQVVPRQIYRERVQVTRVTENRVRATYTLLDSLDMNFLLNWSASLQTVKAPKVWEVKRYSGAKPIVVQADEDLPRVLYSGSAVCDSLFMLPPDPPYPWFAEPPDVTFEWVNSVERRMTFRYVMFPLDGNGELISADSAGLYFPPNKPLARPSQLSFVTGGKL
jgi:hypothetical protein